MNRGTERIFPAFIAAIALLAHAHFFLRAGEGYTRWDSSQYIDAARNMAAGNGFRDVTGAIEARRTPGYPLFLAPFFALGLGLKSIAVMQHLLAAMLAVGVYLAALAMIGDVAVAALAGLLVAVDSGQIFMANYVMTETVMSIVLLAALFVLARFARQPSIALAVAGGLLVAVGVMVRPAAMLLWIPLAVWIAAVGGKRRIGATLAFVAAALSLPMLWTWRNAVRAGDPSLSSIAGEDLYYWRAGGALAMERSGFQYGPLPFSGEEEFRRQFFRVTQHELVAESKRAREKGHLTEAQISALDAVAAKRILREHVPGLVMVTVNGALHLIFDSTWDYAGALYGGLERVILIDLLFAASVLSFIAASIGFIRLRRVDARLAWLLAVMLLYFVAVLSGPEHEQWRYRVPLIPLYSILIASCVIDSRHAGLLRAEGRRPRT